MDKRSTSHFRLSRRNLIRRMTGIAGAVLLAPLSAACRQRIIEVERVVKVEKEVTKIVTEIVKQTVVVERTLAAPESTSPPSPTPSRPPTELNIQAIRTPWARYFQRMTPAFEELFNVTLNWQPLASWASYAGLVASQYAAGTLSDLIEAPAGVLPLRWQRSRLIQSMNAVHESGEVLTKGILAPALAAFQPQGALLGQPFLVHGGDHLLGYNRQLLTSLQLEQPDAGWTLNHLQDLNETVAAVKSGSSGFGTSAALPEAFPLLRLFGIRLFDEQGHLVSTERDRLADFFRWIKSQTMDSPNGIALDPLLSSVSSLEKGYLLATNINLAQLVAWRWQAIQKEREPWFAATLFPRHQDQAVRAIDVNAMGYCLSSATKEYAAAAQWLKYVSGREMGVQLFLQGLAEPGCRAASWTDPRVTDVMPLCATVAKELEQAQPQSLPASLDIENCINYWNRHTARILGDHAPLGPELDLMIAALAKAAEPSL